MVRHADDVIQSLKRDVFPKIGGLPIARLRAPQILALLHQIERCGSIETAKRIRKRILGVSGSAMARGIADSGPIPWLKNELQPIVRRGRGPANTDLDGVGRVLADAEAIPSQHCHRACAHSRSLGRSARRALGRNRGHRLDPPGVRSVPRHRIVPAARMKGTLARTREVGGEHVVPLSMEATEVLLAMRDLGGRLPLILPNQRRSHEPTSENSMGYLLNRVRYHGRHIPHGFRAASSMIMNELASRGGRASDRRASLRLSTGLTGSRLWACGVPVAANT
jgi:hypothetical protein